MYQDELTNAVKQQLLKQELQMWLNTRYQAEVRLRIIKRIGGNTEIEAENMQTLERCEKAIDALKEELAELE